MVNDIAVNVLGGGDEMQGMIITVATDTQVYLKVCGYYSSYHKDKVITLIVQNH